MQRSHRFLNPTFKQSKRFASTNSSSGGGVSKFVAVTLGTTAAGAAGAVGYAAYDSEFRKQVENAIPGTKNVLNYAIGPIDPPAIKLKDLRPLQYSNDPKIPPKPFETNPLEKLEKRSVEAVPGSQIVVREINPEGAKKIELKKELIGVKVPEGLNKQVAKPKANNTNPYIGNEASLDKNELLTEELKKKLAEAEKSTKIATTAKLETLRAIEHHIQTIREAIEGGKDGDWDAVTVAHLKAKRLTDKDIEVEKKARNLVAELVTEANFGSQGKTTQLNPLIPISKATAEKLSNELDEMVSNVKKVDSERIFTRDYGNLVDESRKKFLLELKAVHPELNYEEGMKLKKSDLKTILAHAHLRVDQLTMKLVEMKVKEEKRVKEIIESKKKELLETLKEEAKKSQETPKIETKIVKIPEIDQKKLEEELKKKTREIQEKYDRKLEEVVRTQKQLYDIEHAKDVDFAVAKERKAHSAAIGKALSQLEGIEKALKGHLEMDIENRRSKQMWLATQNLVDTVKYGNRGSCCMEGRRAPIGDQMKTLMKCSGDDKFTKLIDSSMKRISKVKGEYTTTDLDSRFEKVCRIGRRIAYVNEGGVMAHLYSWLKSSLTFTLPIKKGDNIIISSIENNITLLARAEQLWKQGKRLDAIRVLQLTTGATRRLSRDFIDDARRHEETLYLARLLLAHSALTSIRSTY